MSGQKKYSIDMINGPLPGKVLRFAVPFMLANLLQLLFNAADVAVVGLYAGDTAQAAVTSTTSLVALIVNFFIGLGVGVNVMVARTLGSGDRSRISEVTHTAVLTAVLCGVVMAVVSIWAAPGMLKLVDTPEGDLMSKATLYLRIYFVGLPGELVYSFGSALLRAQGDTKRPMYYLTLAGVVNVVLNLFFVIACSWDVSGVATATVISKYLSAVLVLKCLMQETGPIHLDPSKLKIHWPTLKEIVRIGLPAGLQSSLFALSNVTIQSAINDMGKVMGESMIAGAGAAANINTIIHTPTAAFYNAAMTFSSQNIGAGKPKRVDKVHWTCMWMCMLTAAVVGTLGTVFGPQLLGLYGCSQAAVDAGMVRMYVATSTVVLCAFMDVPAGVLRGLGYSILPLAITMSGSCFLRIAWVTWIFPLYNTPVSLYISYPVTWTVTGIVLLACYFIVRPKFYAKARAAQEPAG